MSNTVYSAESMGSWPQPFTVPAGSYYSSNVGESGYTDSDITIELQCAGDWLEITTEDGQRYRYEIS